MNLKLAVSSRNWFLKLVVNSRAWAYAKRKKRFSQTTDISNINKPFYGDGRAFPFSMLSQSRSVNTQPQSKINSSNEESLGEEKFDKGQKLMNLMPKNVGSHVAFCRILDARLSKVYILRFSQMLSFSKLG